MDYKYEKKYIDAWLSSILAAQSLFFQNYVIQSTHPFDMQVAFIFRVTLSYTDGGRAR